MLGISFFFKLDLGSYIVPIAKAASKKTGDLIDSVKVVLRLFFISDKSTIWSCMEYCCHVRADAPSCYLGMLDKLQKHICRTVSPSLAASLEPSVYCWNVARWSLFFKYYYGKCWSELVELVVFPHSRGSALLILIGCLIFLLPLLDNIRMSMSIVSFLAQLGSEMFCLQNAFLYPFHSSFFFL